MCVRLPDPGSFPGAVGTQLERCNRVVVATSDQSRRAVDLTERALEYGPIEDTQHPVPARIDGEGTGHARRECDRPEVGFGHTIGHRIGPDQSAHSPVGQRWSEVAGNQRRAADESPPERSGDAADVGDIRQAVHPDRVRHDDDVGPFVGRELAAREVARAAGCRDLSGQAILAPQLHRAAQPVLRGQPLAGARERQFDAAPSTFRPRRRSTGSARATTRARQAGARRGCRCAPGSPARRRRPRSAGGRSRADRARRAAAPRHARAAATASARAPSLRRHSDAHADARRRAPRR